jgi:hypothetical protein
MAAWFAKMKIVALPAQLSSAHAGTQMDFSLERNFTMKAALPSDRTYLPSPIMTRQGMFLATIDPLIAAGVVLATAATDAVYVMFTSAVVARHRISAATWSSIWYLLSSFAVIHYTENWIYVAFAAAGSWIGAFISLSFLHRPARPLQ